MKYRSILQKGDERRGAFSALLTAWGVNRQEEKETAGEDGRPREPHGFLSPSTANYFNTILAQSAVTPARFFLLLCSHSSPPALINLSYASCWAIRTYVRSLGRGLRHHHRNIGDKKISTRTKKRRALTELTEIFLGRLDLKRTLSRRIRWLYSKDMFYHEEVAT